MAQHIPYAMQRPDRVPKQRYYDAAFFELEKERLWPRVWQMACRLEEIPNVGDAVEYEILDESVIVVRTSATEVRAFQNACRHRGVKLVVDRAECASGFVCPFHGWCYGLDGANTFVSRPSSFAPANLAPDDIGLRPVRCETWGNCAWINFDTDAPPLHDCLAPAAGHLDAWKLESTRAEWWYAFRLPVNWKLAEEAFMEQYHVLETHPQLRIPGRFAPKDPKQFDTKKFLDSELHYLQVMSEGMAGMIHGSDVAVAKKLAKKVKLPGDAAGARATWDATLNDAIGDWHRAQNHEIGDLNALLAQGSLEPMYFGFVNFFVLPQYSSASQYRFRPLGPEETLMEIWSLTRYAPGDEPPCPPKPEVWDCTDPRVPPIPTQDFSNLPRQQRGLHTQDFEYMRLSAEIEGHIGNFHGTIDAFLNWRSYDAILPALHELNLNPLERPVVDLGF